MKLQRPAWLGVAIELFCLLAPGYTFWVRIKGGSCEGGKWDVADLVDLVNSFKLAQLTQLNQLIQPEVGMSTEALRRIKKPT